jgi:hypothetical protein
MTPVFAEALHILSISNGGIQCATVAAPEAPFWLPRRGNYVTWVHPPQVEGFQTAVMPYWLAARHRQLVGDVEFERVRDEHKIAKELTTMTGTPEDAGHGALFKNDKKEKPSHPDYRGDCTIRGRKFWMSAWIKEGQKGKYMSVAFRPAEEEAAKPEPKPQTKVMVQADDDIPF